MSTIDYAAKLAFAQRLVTKFGGLWSITGRKRSNETPIIASPWLDESATSATITGVLGVSVGYEAKEIGGLVERGDMKLILVPDANTGPLFGQVSKFDSVIRTLDGTKYEVINYMEFQPDDVVLFIEAQVRL